MADADLRSNKARYEREDVLNIINLVKEIIEKSNMGSGINFKSEVQFPELGIGFVYSKSGCDSCEGGCTGCKGCSNTSTSSCIVNTDSVNSQSIT